MTILASGQQSTEGSMKYTFFQKVQIWAIELVAKIRWKQKDSLTQNDDAKLKEMFAKDYYIVASRRGNYLTTFFITLGHLLMTGRKGNYSHVLMNLEDEVKYDGDFRFIEATGKGTHYSTYEEVFTGVDAVALIKPKNMPIEEWTRALDDMKIYLGRPYDNLFDLKNNLEINCVELIKLALEKTPDYHIRFAEFEKMARKKKKLTPDMFVQCSDFEVIYKIKR